MVTKTASGKMETEIKVRLNDLPAFTAQLPALGFRLQTPETFERNVLFDTPEGLLRSRRELLRIRKYGNRWNLTHKLDNETSASAHKMRIETETQLDDGNALGAILERLGYQPVFVYEKFRAEWTDDSGHVVLDRTPIGDFAELEGEHAWIDTTAARLGIPRSQYLTDSYACLFFAWRAANKHPAVNMTFAEIDSQKPDTRPR